MYNTVEKGEVEGDENCPTLIAVCLTLAQLSPIPRPAAPCMEPAGVATITFFGEAYCTAYLVTASPSFKCQK